MNDELNIETKIVAIVAIGVLVLGFIGFLMWLIPTYNVWQKELAGKAELRQAEWNRQVQIREAEANLESEVLNAKAEVERAKGVAAANDIIAERLQGQSEYLHYLWIRELSKSNVIYIPTEAGLPILEAERFNQ